MTHCKRGHELTEENIYHKGDGKRQRKICKYETKRAKCVSGPKRHNPDFSDLKDATPSLEVHPLCIMDVKFANGARYRIFKPAYAEPPRIPRCLRGAVQSGRE